MRLFIVQPLLAKYRVAPLQTLASHHDVTLFAQSQGIPRAGLDSRVPKWVEHRETRVVALWGGRLYIQRRVLMAIAIERPDAVLSFANMHFATYWIALVLCRLMRIRFFSHGQGLYAHPRPGLVRTLLVRAACRLSTRYICYADVSRQSLEAAGCHHQKLAVADNSVALDHVVRPDQKTYRENGILFLGRLREHSGLGLLVRAVGTMRRKYPDVELHVIGDGDGRRELRSAFGDMNWITWHGEIYDDGRIAAISQLCRLGCYPGDAGLSIVHYFGLSLPPVVHDCLESHMGPEPSYMRHEVNGFTFPRDGGEQGLAAVLSDLWGMSSERLYDVGSAAFSTYTALNSPPLGERILRIIERG